MADADRRSATVTVTITVNSQSQVPTTRLKNRAPASIEIKPTSNWNVAIPLLSPLVSPSCCGCGNSGQEENVLLMVGENKAREDGKGPTFTKWQHPAAPFYYGSAPRANPFVPV